MTISADATLAEGNVKGQYLVWYEMSTLLRL